MHATKRMYLWQTGKKIVRKSVVPAAVIFLLLAGFFFPGVSTCVLAGNLSLPVFPPAVYCNGAALQFDVSPLPRQENPPGPPMFPLRMVFEECGFSVTWDPATKKVVLIGPGRVVYLSPGNPLFSVNGVVYRTARPPVIVQGRTMVAFDFLQQSTTWAELAWDEKANVLHLKGLPAGGLEPGQVSLPDKEEIGQYDLNLIEVLLPRGEEVKVGEKFQIALSAPFVQGIYAYAVHFSYDPEQIEVQELKNPSFASEQEFAWQKIDNQAGKAVYLQTSLGYLEKIPPRTPLVILEARALQAGMLPLPGDALAVTVLDYTAVSLPVGLEEKTLHINPLPGP